MASNFIIQKGPGIASKAYNYAKKLFTGGSKQKTTGTEVIDKVKPNVPVTKGEKLKSQIKIATQKSKAAQAKLDNTIFRIEQQNKRLGEKKAEGGRIGLRYGTNPFMKKSNIKKIEETFGPKKVTKKEKPKKRIMAKDGSKKKKKKFPDLTGDGKVTFADVLKGRGVINGKKKKTKKKFI
jgi:hypothetical protein